MTAITIPAQPEVIIQTQRRRNLDEAEARTLTATIKTCSVRLWMLVTEAHDRKAHAALGYPTWDDYARAELKMSPSRSYQLLDQGHVMRALASGGADLEAVATPPARVVAAVKDHLPEVRQAAREAAKEGGDVMTELRSLAARSSGSRPGTVTAPAPKADPPPETVVCPVCVGEGKVSRSLARRAQSWLKKKG